MVGDILQPTHLLLVLVVALLVLGPKRLPEVARHLGSGIRDFREAISGEHSDRTAEPNRLVTPVSTPVEAVQTQAVVAEPPLAVVQPEPTVAEPSLAVAQPEPTLAEPMPAVAEPEPTLAEPVPAVAEPEPPHTDAALEPETKQTDAVLAAPESDANRTEQDPTAPLAAPAQPPAAAPDSADAATTELSSQRPT